MRANLPPTWSEALAPQLAAPWFETLCRFVAAERAQHVVFPAEEHVFAAFEATPVDEVKVVLIGQDPYPTPGHAHGLCFSVQPGVALPGSLRNMYKELNTDLGVPIASTGYLMPWARQGMLLLNTVLTVRSGEPNSHKGQGWEKFTDAVIDVLSRRAEPTVFVLWGTHAKKKAKRVDTTRHAIVAGAHPSPLSAKQWFGSRPFSQIDDALRAFGKPPMDWTL